jgi:hypothetical protein
MACSRITDTVPQALRTCEHFSDGQAFFQLKREPATWWWVAFRLCDDDNHYFEEGFVERCGDTIRLASWIITVAEFQEFIDERELGVDLSIVRDASGRAMWAHHAVREDPEAKGDPQAMGVAGQNELDTDDGCRMFTSVCSWQHPLEIIVTETLNRDDGDDDDDDVADGAEEINVAPAYWSEILIHYGDEEVYQYGESETTLESITESLSDNNVRVWNAKTGKEMKP